MKQALVVGINNYSKQPLTGCVKDAEEISKVLNYNEDNTLNFETKSVLDIQSKAELRGMIRNLFSCEADIVLFYFAGHGYIDESGGYLVTPDGEKNDPGIPMDEILTYANQSDIRTKIIILDCCSSGAFGVPAAIGQGALLRKGMTILTSCRENESAKEENNGHGVFTCLLLDALRGGASDLKGDITPGSIYAHIDMAIGNWGQRPIFRTNVTRFTPVRKVKPPIEIETLKKITVHFPDPGYDFPLNPSFEWTEPSAIEVNVERFKELQKMNRVGLVIPVGANPNDMYFAAIQSKICRLTALGKHYWHLVKDNRI